MSFSPNIIKDINLTEIYYAKKVFSYMKQVRLTKKWQWFINLPVKQQLLEQASNILIQWCMLKAHVSNIRVEVKLNKVAHKVLTCLKVKSPTHPIFSLSSEQMNLWKYNNIDDSYWQKTEAKQILYMIKFVMRYEYIYQQRIQDSIWSEISYNPVSCRRLCINARYIFLPFFSNNTSDCVS